MILKGTIRKRLKLGWSLDKALETPVNTAKSHTANRSHGESTNPTPEYRVWQHLKRRCENPNNPAYKYYGGRGIKVCKRWQSYENFLEDMGRRPSLQHSIDRRDNNGNYEPSNCRWATKQEQARNSRNNHMMTIGELTLPMWEWVERTGISRGVMKNRIRKGWSDEQTLTTPIDVVKSHKRKVVICG